MDGKVEELLPKLCSKEKADVIFVDPPRSGLDGNYFSIFFLSNTVTHSTCPVKGNISTG